MNPLRRLRGLPGLPGLIRLPLPRLPGSEVLVDLGVHALFQGRRAQAYAGLVSLARPEPGDTVVDVGSGTGYLATLLARRVTPGGEVIGVEPSPAAVDRARGRAAHGCRFEVGSAHELPMGDGAADLVMSSLLVHHIEPAERPAAVVEMARVLRPGGRLFLADLKRLDNPVLNAGAGAVIPCFSAALTHPELIDLVTGGGFHVERSGEYWGRMRYVAAVRD